MKLYHFFTSTIRRKILSSYAIVIILVLGMAIGGYYQLTQVRDFSAQVGPDSLQTGYLQDYALAISSLDASLERLFVIGGEQFESDVVQDLERINDALAAIQENATPDVDAALAGLETVTHDLRTEVEFLLAVDSAEMTSDEMNKKIISVYEQIDQAKDLHDTLSVQTIGRLQETVQQQNIVISNMVAQFLGVIFLVTLMAVLVYLFVTRSIATPLIELTSTAQQIETGNLDARAPVKTRDEIGQLAQTFNRMTAQLAETLAGLEQRVAARTERLETLGNLSERLNAILNLDELLAELVNQIQDKFGYYHAHIYLLDETSNKLVVAAGTGQAGAEMKAGSHHISLDAPASLVARAAHSKQIVAVDNVRESPDWLPNRLLPDTYSEMAVPIILEGKMVGVLDVQEDKIAGLDDGDAGLLRSLAGQVAVAIRNARLFSQAETALAEARIAQEKYIAQSWDKTKITHRGRHIYADPAARPLDRAARQVLDQAKERALTQNKPTVSGTDDEATPNKLLSVPINLREQTIGALQVYNAGSGEWADDDLALVNAVVDQLSQTAENLRLFEEARGQASREQTIREITDKLKAAPNLDSLLEMATRELGQRLGVRHTVLELGLEPASNGGDNQGQQE